MVFLGFVKIHAGLFLLFAEDFPLLEGVKLSNGFLRVGKVNSVLDVRVKIGSLNLTIWVKRLNFIIDDPHATKNTL